jgi:hypothetical protein
MRGTILWRYGVRAALSLILTLAAGAVLGAKGPTLTMDGGATELGHAYAFESPNEFSPDAHDVTVLFADRELKSAILANPLELRKMLMEGGLHLLAVSIDGDKQPYSLVLVHQTLGPGILLAGGPQIGLEVKKFTSSHVKGRIFTDAPKKMMDHSWTFDGPFDLPLTPLATSSVPRQVLQFAQTWLGPGDKAWALLTVDGAPVLLSNVMAVSGPALGDKNKRDTTILFSSEPVSSKSIHATADLRKAAMDGHLQAVMITVDEDKTAYAGEVYHPAFGTGLSVSGTKQFDFEEVHSSPDTFEGRLSRAKSDSGGHPWSFDSVFTSSVTDLAPRGKPLPMDGGAPGKAYLAYLKVFQKGDMKALRDAVSAERAKSMDDPDFVKMFPMIQEMTPKQVKIKGGLIDGSRATLNVSGQVMGGPSDGTVTMVLEAKKWKVEREAWSSGSN